MSRNFSTHERGSQSGACFKCGESGHLARNCPNSAPQTKRADGAQSGACFKCGESGHLARNCPNAAPLAKQDDRTCRKCGEVGHIARDCGRRGGEGGRQSSDTGRGNLFAQAISAVSNPSRGKSSQRQSTRTSNPSTAQYTQQEALEPESETSWGQSPHQETWGQSAQQTSPIASNEGGGQFSQGSNSGWGQSTLPAKADSSTVHRQSNKPTTEAASISDPGKSLQQAPANSRLGESSKQVLAGDPHTGLEQPTHHFKPTESNFDWAQPSQQANPLVLLHAAWGQSTHQAKPVHSISGWGQPPQQAKTITSGSEQSNTQFRTVESNLDLGKFNQQAKIVESNSGWGQPPQQTKAANSGLEQPPKQTQTTYTNPDRGQSNRQAQVPNTALGISKQESQIANSKSGWGQSSQQTKMVESNSGWGKPTPQAEATSSSALSTEEAQTPTSNSGWGKSNQQTKTVESHSNWGQPTQQAKAANSGLGLSTEEAQIANSHSGWGQPNHQAKAVTPNSGWGQPSQEAKAVSATLGQLPKQTQTADPNSGWGQSNQQPKTVESNSVWAQPTQQAKAVRSGSGQAQTIDSNSGWGQSNPQTRSVETNSGWNAQPPVNKSTGSGWDTELPKPINNKNKEDNWKPTPVPPSDNNNGWGTWNPPKPKTRTGISFHGETDENPIIENQLFGGSNHLSAGINFDKYFDIPVQISGEDPPGEMDKFDEKILPQPLMANLQRCNFQRPTPVQRFSIPFGVAGRDMMACAQTGSGKTAGFLFPIIISLLRTGPTADPPIDYKGKNPKIVAYPYALVLGPTRELVTQIYDEALRFCYRTGIRPVVVYGGQDMKLQGGELDQGADLLIATPGRLYDFIEKGKISLSKIQFLVLDEADRMLDMGFELDMRVIIEDSGMPKEGRKTFMFSATFPPDIQRLASYFMERYIFVQIGRVGSAAADVAQTVLCVAEDAKRDELNKLLAKNAGQRVLVFVKTKKEASHLERSLEKQGIGVNSIHGDKLQSARERALEDFKTGETMVLIATDVASRGLDIPHIELVVNYDLPKSIDDYVHRIGRTGRAGNTGNALAYFDPETDLYFAKPLMELLEENGQEVPPFLRSFAASEPSRAPRRTGNNFCEPDYRDPAERSERRNQGKPRFIGRPRSAVA